MPKGKADERMRFSLENKRWVWLLLLLFLPTMHGCEMVIGFPFSTSVGINGEYFEWFDLEDFFGIFLLNIAITTVLFFLFFEKVRAYFAKHRGQFVLISCYFIYEAFVTVAGLFEPTAILSSLKMRLTLHGTEFLNLVPNDLNGPSAWHVILLFNMIAFAIVFAISFIIEQLAFLFDKIPRNGKTSSDKRKKAKR